MASSTNARGSTEPLLPPKLQNNPTPESLTPLASGTLKTLSVMRIVLGASTLVAPRWTCALFFYPLPATAGVLARLFGIREVVLGELLYTAEDKTAADGGKREIKRALWANMASDAVDLGSVTFALATGTLGRIPSAAFAGGAIFALVLGGISMKGLKGKDEA
ncbi:hypothetical protein BU24DRAFT_416557 [Aaosphaeria arxii CBS 175.79]|uniref:Uncharacterized protein n=1 Tax=Aaosphaeria arxii CBS 175.79 TaxID=1450172 RepID=A0A6A5Y5R1_9PLEO|nr:uncharacterized protein BU24DRAFT_416557 [Aaosphaeria arxii CBS 175.79]KAF2020895.1 hypothetical protein BU24DRAFT_416557 [Aaosphaeria arxii CBS 175.79]